MAGVAMRGDDYVVNQAHTDEFFLNVTANLPHKETATPSLLQNQTPLQKTPSHKTFAQTLMNKVELNTSQLPQPCLKGDVIAIKIPKEDYQAEDLRSVCSVCSWSLKPGLLRLFLLSPDFNPSQKKLTHAECWIKIHNLPQEYWIPRIILSIVGGICTPITLDEATSSRNFGHFAKVLVEINLKTKLTNKIHVESEGFALFVYIEYHNLPEFCLGCQTIGHSDAQCKKSFKKSEDRVEGVV
ncbi:hypothetical protein Lal_00044727 [Lupinus albus]|nr:hypothetical protein Lal_00044727 [Lupinus albus]